MNTLPINRPFDAILSAPGFALGLHYDVHTLHEIVFLAPQTAQPASTPLGCEIERQLRQWLSDPHHRFDLPLASQGSAFRQKVWQAISAIPLGETRSYGELAKAIGSAPRAVGGACGDNPYPIVVPCHRVVAQSRAFNGGLGGFAHARGGLHMDIKRWLLNHEQNAI